MDNQTPPPNPDEEWAKKLKLDYDAEKAAETETRMQQAQTPPTPPPFPGMPQGAPMPLQAPTEGEEMPQTYMLWSVLALVFCCFPTAVVAIIYSAQVSSKFYAKDYEGARRCSERAQAWIIASIVLGVISMAVYLSISLLLPS